MAPLAHRGLWLAPDQRNSLAAFRDAFSHGCGVELDVRDLDGTLVVSHDPPLAGALTFDAVVAAWREHDGGAGALAINVKADGLDEMISDALRDTDPARSFVFDMSIPDALHYVCAGIPYYARHSEVEPEPALYPSAAGVWLDDFAGWFISEERIAAHLEAGKRVAVVSPELHGRDHESTWSQWRQWDVWRSPDVLLCTDHPTRAQEVFA
jgi:glycerophosphoryl diester phosphodiesterase